MAVVVTHSTPSDSSFSTQGAAAWNAQHSLSGVGTMAEQNANNVAVTGGAIDGTAIGGTTPAAATFTTLTATGQTSLGGAAGAEALRAVTTASAVNWVQVAGAASGGTPYVGSQGAGTNINIDVFSKGTGNIRLNTNSNAVTQALVSHTASAVNYVQVTGAATTAAPVISAQGSDTNINIGISAKGSGVINLNAATRLSFGSTNYIQVAGAATTVAPAISALGTDTNIDLALTPKGTGVLSFGTYTAGVVAQTGYITIKDSGGTTRRLLVG